LSKSQPVQPAGRGHSLTSPPAYWPGLFSPIADGVHGSVKILTLCRLLNRSPDRRLLELPLGGSTSCVMQRRRRIRQTISLRDSLAAFAKIARELADALPPGSERDSLLTRARRANNASNLENWLNRMRVNPGPGDRPQEKGVVREARRAPQGHRAAVR
jgi:hypothetical protein